MIKIDLGNTRGVKRKVDNLGRITLPKDFRDELKITNRSNLYVHLLPDGIYISK